MEWGKQSLKPTKQLAVIIGVLIVLSSIPNLGNFSDSLVCASPVCKGVKLQNPVILPYSWMLPEKKCNFCNFPDSVNSVVFSSYFPAIHIMDVIISVSYLLILAFFIDAVIVKIRKRIKK